MRDLAFDFAAHVARVKYSDLPADTIAITKKFVLDTLATTIAGSSAPGCQAVAEYVKDCGGKKESTVMVYGGKVLAAEAALANGTMSHALDFDDTHDEAVLHANVSVLPAALATAERRGGVSGKEFIAAMALGVDVASRVALGATGILTWALTSTAGFFGAAAASGKLIGLDEDEILHAMGVAYSQCAGNIQCLLDGALVKRMQPAFAARAGVQSALLAERGLTGSKNIFEGKFGYYTIYHNGKYDRDRAIAGLGKSFEGNNLSVKLYPACRYTHASIDATLGLVREYDIKPEDVVEVCAHLTQAAYNSVGRPFEIRDNPQVDAQFSVPYTVAVAITRRDVFIDNFFAENIRSETKIQELAKKVKVFIDQELMGKGLTPAVIEIKTKSQVYSRKVDVLSGSPQKPASMEDIANKLRKCVPFSARPLSKAKAEQLIEAVSNLENVADMSEVIRLAVGRAA